MLWPFAITELMTVLVGCFLSFTIPTSPSPSLHGRNSNRFLYTTTEYVMAFCTPVPSHILAHSVVWLRNQFKCKSVYGFIYASADNNANPFYMACLKIHISMFEIRKIERERERESERVHNTIYILISVACVEWHLLKIWPVSKPYQANSEINLLEILMGNWNIG